MRPALAVADGYLLTSRYEGQSIGALEAFEAGMPIILNQFEGAEDLATTHPQALVLTFDNLAADANRIAKLIEDYRANRETMATDIRAAWATSWSFEVFEGNVRALVEKWMENDPSIAALR